MPLRALSEEIIRLCDSDATPVLVTPEYLSLRSEFFVQLVQALRCHTDRRIRIDWVRSSQGGVLRVIGDVLARRSAIAINRALQEAVGKNGLAPTASIDITAMLGRPQGFGASGFGSQEAEKPGIESPGIDEFLRMGVCQQSVELPRWAAAIRLGADPIAVPASTPSGRNDLQFS